MLYTEIVAVCSQIHTKHINTLCGQNGELCNTKRRGTYSNLATTVNSRKCQFHKSGFSESTQALTLRRLSHVLFNILLHFDTMKRHVLHRVHCDVWGPHSGTAEDSDLQDVTQRRGLTFRWFVLSSSSNVNQSKNSSTLEYKSTPMFR